MHTYHLSRRFFAGLRQRLLLVFVLLLAAFAGLFIWMGTRQSGSLGTVPQILTGLAFVGALGLVGWNAYRQQKRIWASFRITLNGDSLARSQIDRPTLTISRSEITSIEDLGSRGLLVRTADPHRQMRIPASLDGYAELRAVLAGWLPSEREMINDQ